MATDLRSKLISVLLSLSFACGGCAMPAHIRTTKSQRLARLSYGMSDHQVRKSLKNRGEPIFSFTESGVEHQCWAFFSSDTGILYYLLSVGDELTAITTDRQQADLRHVSALDGTNDLLPHQGGFLRVTQPFEGFATEIAGIDFSKMKPGYRPPRLSMLLAEIFMWSPVMILSSWYTIPALSWGNAVYAKMHRLRVGMSPARVMWTAGKPDRTLGDADNYQVWVYERRPTADGDTITVSLGVRSGHVGWLRYGYNAYEDHLAHRSDP